MRFAVIFLLIALFGCTQQPANPAQPSNATPPAQTPQLVESGYIYPPALPSNTSAQNVSQPPPLNLTNITQPPNQNQSQNSTQPRGMMFGNGTYTLVLDDVSMIPTSAQPCGIFSIRNSTDDSILDKVLLCPGESEDWVAADGHSYRILVGNVAAGYTHESEWAEVFIYG